MPCDAQYPPVGSRIGIVPPHDAAIRPRVLAYLYRLGVNAEYILGAINGYSYFLADFFSKPNRKLASGIELSPTDLVWKILLTIIMQSMKKKIFAVESEGFGSYAESNYFEVGELGTTPHLGTLPNSLTRFPVKSLQIPRILTKFAMKLRISRLIGVNGVVTTNLLIICVLCNFPIYIYLEI